MMGVQKYFMYLVRRTLMGVLGLFIIIWLLVLSIDLIEAMREVSKVENAGMTEAILMTFFRTPQLMLTLSPFIFLFGTLWAFGQMAKTSEIAVMRSAGLSVWRIVAAPVALAIGIGFLITMGLDPLATKMASQAQNIKNEMRGKEANMLTPFRDGIWLRQNNGQTASTIHAQSYDQDNKTLSKVV
ncbi:MAG: LptF/LptG family permease, partial [Pseudomonadota bacterium]